MIKYTIKKYQQLKNWITEFKKDWNTQYIEAYNRKAFLWENGFVTELKPIKKERQVWQLSKTTGQRERITKTTKAFAIQKGKHYLFASNRKNAVKKFRREGFTVLENKTHRTHPIRQV